MSDRRLMGIIAERDAEIARLKAALLEQGRELERWKHGEQIEGDYVCPDSLALTEARKELDAMRNAAPDRAGLVATIVKVVADRDAARAEVERLRGERDELADECDRAKAIFDRGGRDGLRIPDEIPLHEKVTGLYAERNDARADAAALRERLTRIERFDTPWPLRCVLERLIGAAEHLLRDHDCDAHGWEVVQPACAAAEEIRRALAAPGEPAQTKEDKPHG